MLDSDEDEIDETGAEYLEKLEKRIHTHSNGTIEVRNQIIISGVSVIFMKYFEH